MYKNIWGPYMNKQMQMSVLKTFKLDVKDFQNVKENGKAKTKDNSDDD